jgi:hypothetical protein
MVIFTKTKKVSPEKSWKNICSYPSIHPASNYYSMGVAPYRLGTELACPAGNKQTFQGPSKPHFHQAC